MSDHGDQHCRFEEDVCANEPALPLKRRVAKAPPKIGMKLSHWNTISSVTQAMLECRGWQVWWETGEDPLLLHKQLVNANSMLVRVLMGIRGDHERLLMFVCLQNNFTAPVFAQLQELRGSATHLLVIYQDKVTATLPQGLVYDLECKPFKELFVNLHTHAMVPRHRIPSAEELSEAIQRYGDPKTYPSLQSRDAVVLWYRFPLGTVVLIERTVVKFRTVRAALIA